MRLVQQRIVEHCLLICRNLSNKDATTDEKKPNEPIFHEGNIVSRIYLFECKNVPVYTKSRQLKLEEVNPKDLVNIHAIIDTGSHRSYVLER